MAVEKLQTSHGLDIYVEPIKGMKSFDAEVAVKVGGIDDPDALAGISHVLEHSVSIKTPSFNTKAELREFTDGHAFYRNANTTLMRTIYLTMGLEIDAMIKVLGEVTTQAQFGEERVNNEIASVRREVLTGLDKIDNLHPVFSSYVHFGVPYGRRVAGYHDRLDFTEQQIIDFYEKYYKFGNMALFVVGDISPERVVELAEQHFVGEKSDEPISRVLEFAPSPSFPDETGFGYLREANENARLSLSVATPLDFNTRNEEKDGWAYEAAETIIARKVFELLREKLGLSYDPYFGLYTSNHPSARRMAVNATVNPENVDRTFDAMQSIMDTSIKSYDDKTISTALITQRKAAAAEVDSILTRNEGYIGYYTQDLPILSADESYDELKTVTVDEVRVALSDIIDTWHSGQALEMVTGPTEAIGDRHIVSQSKFA